MNNVDYNSVVTTNELELRILPMFAFYFLYFYYVGILSELMLPVSVRAVTASCLSHLVVLSFVPWQFACPFFFTAAVVVVVVPFDLCLVIMLYIERRRKKFVS